MKQSLRQEKADNKAESEKYAKELKQVTENKRAGKSCESCKHIRQQFKGSAHAQCLVKNKLVHQKAICVSFCR